MKSLVVIDIPNGKAMAHIAKHLGYSSETIEQFRQLNPEHFPTYIQAYNPKNEHFWGSNMAWVPEYRYRHVEYKEYIKEHKLKPKQYTKREAQKWLDEQLSTVKESFMRYFPGETYEDLI